MSAIESPRSPQRRLRGRTNTELYAWLFMRVSGVLLVVLVLGHLFIMNILDGGVQRINFGFVAGRWASPFWQVWDLLMLWLAQLHGTNGLRIIAVDFWSRGPRLQRQLLWLIVGVWVVVMVPGAFFMLKHSVEQVFGS